MTAFEIKAVRAVVAVAALSLLAGAAFAAGKTTKSDGDWGPIENNAGPAMPGDNPPDAGASASHSGPGLKTGPNGELVERKRPEKPPLDISKWAFTPDSVKKVIAYHQDDIQDCYEDSMANKNGAIEGKLMTSFVIIGDGHVKEAKVLKKGTTVKEVKLNACVVSVLGEMVFPKPPDNKRHPVEFPFNLKAVQ